MLVYGQSGTGKTVLGLSFPKIVAVDSEDGYAWYEGTDRAKNIVGILDTQSFEDLSNLLDDLEDSIDEFDTLIVDSETKIHENIQEALIEVEESRALRKGKDVLDANLSIRSYGKIKQLESRLQNLKVKLASQGINIVSIAQAQDEMKDMGNNKRIKIGEKPNMAKNAQFDYDVVLRLFVKDGKYMGIVEKDRTETYERGAEIDEAIDISYRHGIQDEIEHTSDAEAYFLRNQSQDSTDDVEVEKQFQIQVVVEFTPSRERYYGSQYAQNIHERKEVSITSYRFKCQAQSLLDVFLPIHIFHIIISHFSFLIPP